MDISAPPRPLGPLPLRRWEPDLDELVVLALDGGETDQRTRATDTGDRTGSGLKDWMLEIVEHATTLLDLGNGNYEAALAASLERRRRGALLGVTYPNIVEAAVRCGRAEVAFEATDALAALITGGGSALGLGLLARCRALVDDGPSADLSYRESIARLDTCASTVELARTRLVYGEWLRRAKRPTDARTQLRTARDAFAAAGTPTFAERAKMELAATGEHRRRETDRGVELTPQEARIAELASFGWTNAEIAGHLFLSKSTVDYHLRKVFRKMGISSRRRLGEALLLVAV